MSWLKTEPRPEITGQFRWERTSEDLWSKFLLEAGAGQVVPGES